MTTVVCDASPLIFLAKLDRLTLIGSLLGGEVVVLQGVVAEVLAPAENFHAEQQRLREFLGSIRIVTIPEPTQPSGRLSASDARTLAYAVRHCADWLVADERLLRRIAAHEGIATIGTLGLLVLAARRGLLTGQEAMADVDTAVSSHHLRISIALYRDIRRELLEVDASAG
jgi:predicted nucleic acid-binding protein